MNIGNQKKACSTILLYERILTASLKHIDYSQVIMYYLTNHYIKSSIRSLSSVTGNKEPRFREESNINKSLLDKYIPYRNSLQVGFNVVKINR